MSSSLAIAAVTATLRKILEDSVSAVSGAVASTQPPDKVTTTNLVNLFLYHTVINAAWRNREIPRQVKPGETGQPPLALNLYYLLTAYGQGDDSQTVDGHRLLGLAMRGLHDNPVLSSAEINAAFPDGDLDNQIEHVRITPQPMSLDEMSKLWTTFQAKYRISTAYEVSVVLIESARPSRTPLPVLKRGEDDRGVDAQGNLTPPFPTLEGIAFANERQPSAQLGDTLILRGHHLDGDSLTARFSNPRLNNPLEIVLPAPITTTDTTDILVTLPVAGTSWVAGYYTVSLGINRSSDPANPTRTTNELSFSIAPRLTIPPLEQTHAAGNFTLTLTCSPEVRPEQRLSLLFGSREVSAPTLTTPTASLAFELTNVAAGEYLVRLRVDGVDSLLVKYDETPPVFDDTQKVTIT
jgi:hypothetical protein